MLLEKVDVLLHVSNLLLGCGVFDAITKPIRVTNSSSTIIDHILTNDTKHSVLPGILCSDISDHNPIFCQINNFHSRGSNVLSKIFYRDKSNFKADSYCQDLETNLYDFGDHHLALIVTNLNDAFNEFIAVISGKIDAHAPLKPLSNTKKTKKEALAY